MIKDNQEYNENTKPNSAFENELRSKLPEFFNRNGFDLDKFQEALREHNVNEFSEGYQLSFIGKDYARKQAGDLPTTVIVPDNNHNQKEENRKSKNLFFTGDNLEVLRHLRNVYSNKIDIIYIDPPYNTGNDDFVYPDKFDYSNEQLEEIFGMSDKDIEKLNHLKESKSHSAWLTFMYPRLWLAKQLLTNDGVIFVSIDDNEQANLKLLMDDIFGENNFVANFLWNKSQNPPSISKTIRHKYEYICLYKKYHLKGLYGGKISGGDSPLYNSGNNKTVLTFPPKSVVFNIPDGQYDSFICDNDSINLLTSVIIEDGTNKNEFKLEGNFRWKQGTLEKELSIGSKIFIKSKNFSPRYFREGDRIITPSDVLSMSENDVDTNEKGRKEVEQLVGKNIFSFPKPTSLIKRIIQMHSLYVKKDSLILDFFAGSSTTADAVMQLNAEDGGNRQFIMVQLPELTYKINEKTGEKEPTKGGKAAFEAGYMSIDEISRERIRRASKKIKEENPDLFDDLDGGFKHYRVVNPNITTLNEIDTFDPNQYKLVNDMITPFSSEQLGIPGNASGEDTILTTWLVQDGYGFNNISLKEYDFLGYKAYGVEDTRLYLINGSWTTEQTEMLVNQLGNHIVNFKSIVVYGYSFNMPDLRELELALSQLNTKVELIKRY